MDNQEFEQKLQERWEDLMSLGDSIPSAKECFDYAFSAGYDLGKHEKDAEGEEMLTVPRKDVIAEFDKLHKYSYQCSDLQLGLNAFRALFGSKCLPDETKPLSQNPLENCDNEDHISTDDNKTAEPKFKVGDLVIVDAPTNDLHGKIGTVTHLDHVNEGYIGVTFDSVLVYVPAVHLEPYTEPTQTNDNMEDKYYCGDGMCCRNGEGYLKPMQCDKELCNRRAQKPKRWRAEKGEYYWFFDRTYTPYQQEESGDIEDDIMYDAYNYFRTKEHAQQAAEAVKKTLEQFHKENQQ